MNNKVYEIVTDRILKLMEAGKLVWVKNWKANSAQEPKNFVSKKAYQGFNFFMLSSLPYTQPYYLSFKQVTDLGGKVKKGEKSVPVIFWKLNQYNNEKADGTTENKSVPMLRYYNVFNIEQTEGIKWDPDKDKVQEKPAQRIKKAEAVVKKMPQKPLIEYSDNNRACYNKVKDLVTIPKIGYFFSPEAYYSTLFHELAHATGHPTRLNRAELLHVSAWGDENYSKEELTAELTASFVCANIGISNEDNIRNSAAYLQGWSRAIKGDPKMFVHAAARAQKAANFILGIKNEVPTEAENN